MVVLCFFSRRVFYFRVRTDQAAFNMSLTFAPFVFFSYGCFLSGTLSYCHVYSAVLLASPFFFSQVVGHPRLHLRPLDCMCFQNCGFSLRPSWSFPSDPLFSPYFGDVLRPLSPLCVIFYPVSSIFPASLSLFFFGVTSRPCFAPREPFSHCHSPSRLFLLSCPLTTCFFPIHMSVSGACLPIDLHHNLPPNEHPFTPPIPFGLCWSFLLWFSFIVVG